MTVTGKGWLLILAIVVLAGSCKDSGSSPRQAKFAACDSREIWKRCLEKTAGSRQAVTEETCRTNLEGTVLNACPPDGVVATCTNRKDTSEEVTFFYYTGHFDDGRQHCAEQKIYNGVYTKK